MIKIHLSKIMGTKRMTQAELSRKTGIRPNTICDIYNELCESVKLEHLDLICKELDCEISELLEVVPTERQKIVVKKKY